MPDGSNPFIWSHRRASRFVRCPRRYWFSTYGLQTDGARNPAARARTVDVLNHLTTRAAWSDATVHRCLNWIIKTLQNTGSAPSEEQALHLLGKRMNRDFTASGEGLYWEDPDTHAGLLEHEYEEREVPDDVWTSLFESTLGYVSRFYASESFRALSSCSTADWLDTPSPGVFSLDDAMVEVELDAAHREKDRVILYDWRTPGSTRAQPGALGLFAVRRWGTAPESIVVRILNLSDGALDEHALDASLIEAAEQTIQSSVLALRALHGAAEERFPLTDDEARCGRCAFTRICPRFAGAAG